MTRLEETGEWVVHSPLFFLTITLAAYQLGRWLRTRTDGHGLAQPALVAIAIVAPVILLLGVDYDDYAEGTRFISFLLGPATVALAIPLHRQLHLLSGRVLPMLLAVGLGALVGVGSALLLVTWLGGADQLARSVGPKTATTPVAIAVAERAGGIGELAAVLAIAIGILGAVAGPWALDRLGLRDHLARGLAVGAVSHGIGTAHMLHDDEKEGAFSGLSMGLTALAVSLVTPILVALLL